MKRLPKIGSRVRVSWNDICNYTNENLSAVKPAACWTEGILIKANKDFELLLLPNRNHSYVDDPYLTRRKWDFFVRHLRNEDPPEGYEIEGP